MSGECTFKDGMKKGKGKKRKLWEKLSSSKKH